MKKSDKYEYSRIRQYGKVFQLGKQYGMGIDKTIDSAKDYNVQLTLEESKRYHYLFFKIYPEYKKYHADIHKRALKQDYLCSLSGRRLRGFNEILNSFTTATNFRVQATNSDALKLALGTLFYRLKEAGYHPTKDQSIQIISCIHDEIILFCKESISKYTSSLLEDTMVKAAKHFIPNMPIDAEAGIGDSWSEAKT